MRREEATATNRSVIEAALKRGEVEWVRQPCGEPGLFTTTGVGRIRQKTNQPTRDERLSAFAKAKDQASFWAAMFCATNPECPRARFVKYINMKEVSANRQLVLELTIQWQCEEEVASSQETSPKVRNH